MLPKLTQRSVPAFLAAHHRAPAHCHEAANRVKYDAVLSRRCAVESCLAPVQGQGRQRKEAWCIGPFRTAPLPCRVSPWRVESNGCAR